MMKAMWVAAAIVVAGCYNYQPVTLTATPERGIYLAATLTDSGSTALARYLGPEATVVRGRCLGASDAGLLLSVTTVETRFGDELAWQGETVTLPLPLIASIRSRSLAKGRTGMLIGLGVAGIVGSAAAFSLIGSGGPVSAGGGRPNPQ